MMRVQDSPGAASLEHSAAVEASSTPADECHLLNTVVLVGGSRGPWPEGPEPVTMLHVTEYC
jgi:hypothetical protein